MFLFGEQGARYYRRGPNCMFSAATLGVMVFNGVAAFIGPGGTFSISSLGGWRFECESMITDRWLIPCAREELIP